jgi:hypothetical protein
MAEETITILRVGTDEAVKNVNDLKVNISRLKEKLGTLEIGTKEYQETLQELKVNQNALKDAMYATSTSMEDVTKAANGASESYNSLVHRMASLKEEFRATNDEVRRAELGRQIKEVNDQLKDLDALQGNFQRNVGNYTESFKSAFKSMAEKTDALGKSITSVGGGVNGLKNGFDAFSKSPGVATIGILVSIVIRLADKLKENETAMAGIKKGMDALKPVMDFFSNILERVAEFLSEIIGKVATFLTSNGLFNKIINGVMGVGNAILQFVIAPFKAVVAAIQVFKEQGIKGLGNAARAFGQEIKSGVSFKQNFQAGQAVAETFISGAKSKKKAVNQAGKDLGKEAADGFLSEMDKLSEELDRQFQADIDAMFKAQETANKNAVKSADERIKALDKATAHQLELNSILTEDAEKKAAQEYAIQETANQRKLSLLDQFKQDALDRGDIDAFLAYDQERVDLELEIETNAIREKERLRKQDLKNAEKNAKAQRDLLKGVASATSSILGSIADMYDSDEEQSEANAEKIKNLRIAAATIDTISGAIGAYMQSVQTIPPPLGIITGALQAAAVTAAGIVQISKMKNTKMSGSSAPSTPTAPAVTAAPSVTTRVSNVRSVTTASEEDRLNQMASRQRVYILSSDIEASQDQIKTQVEESSF